MRVVQEHMGHSTYATTEKYYGHLDKSARRLSVKVMSEAGMKISPGKEQDKDNEKNSVLCPEQNSLKTLQRITFD